MARKTFISYKYSEACSVRDRIIEAMGSDAAYYQGEHVFSPDLTSTSVENIKSNLKDMIFDTSVLIVVISPNYAQSNWIDWEIEYSLKVISRSSLYSRTNGVVGVIQKVNGSYDWLVSKEAGDDGCSTRTISSKNLSYMVNKNRYNLITDDKFACDHCRSYSQLNGSYIALIEEDAFIRDPGQYIENAYQKSQELDNYDLVKVRG